MKRRTIRLIIILLFGLIICYCKVIEINNDDFLLYGIINLVLEIVATIYLIWTILRDGKEYRKTKTGRAFLPTIIGFTIGIGFLTTLYIFNLRDKSPVQFSCQSTTGYNNFTDAHIDFRQDGTYKLETFAYNYRGKYLINDSIITLDKSNIEKVVESKRFVIKAVKMINGESGKYIYQIDKKGKAIDKAVVYRLIEN